MGYYLYIGKLPRQEAPISREEVMGILQAHPRCRMITPEMDPHYDEPFFIFSYGRLDVMKTPPKDGSLQAPWIEVRTSWGDTESAFREALELVLSLSETLGMSVIDGRNAVVTRDNMESIVGDFSSGSSTVRGLFGQAGGANKPDH